MPKFDYASDWKPIEANPHELKGPGWEAKLEGNCKVSKFNVLYSNICHAVVTCNIIPLFRCMLDVIDVNFYCHTPDH